MLMSPDLFSELSFSDVTADNRIMVSPMCQYSCDYDGHPTEWHRVHYGSRAVGQAGIVMTEATAVEPRGRISPRDLGLWTDQHIESFRPITQFLKEQGSVPAVQLAHAGRKASTAPPVEGGSPLTPEEGGWETVGPTDSAYPREQPLPTKRLSTDDIQTIIDQFGAAARRADAAGFEVVEIHAAHGYLLHQFLSPVTNTREDAYGGSFENRVRMLREVTQIVRETLPREKSIFVRISATDWLPDRASWTVQDSIKLANYLNKDGADLIDVSAGGIHPDQQIPDAGPNYMVPYAERIGQETDLLVGAVGKITTGQQADALIRNDRADVAIVGREFLRDPYFPLRAAEDVDATDRINWPPQYRRA